MSRSLLMMVAVASACLAQYGGGPCGSGQGPGHCRTRASDPHGLPWMEKIMRWEEMFPPMRGFGFLLAGLDLSRDQSEGIADIVEAADEEIRGLELEMAPVDPRRGFLESFVSADFQPVDLELAVDRMEEFHDAALLVVSSAVEEIRWILTEEQLSTASGLVESVREFGPGQGSGCPEGIRPRF